MRKIFIASVSWENSSGQNTDVTYGVSFWSSGKNEIGYFESKEDAEKFIAERKDDTGFSYINECILWEPGEYSFEKSEAARTEVTPKPHRYFH